MSSPTIISPIQQLPKSTTKSTMPSKKVKMTKNQPPEYFNLQPRSNLEKDFRTIANQRPFTEFEALCWLEMQARFCDKPKTLTKLGATFFLSKGQFFTTVKYLGLFFNWTAKKVNCQLKKWSKHGLILVLPVKNPKNSYVGSIIHCRRMAEYDPQQTLIHKQVYFKQSGSATTTQESQAQTLSRDAALDEEGADDSRADGNWEDFDSGRSFDSHDSYNYHSRTGKDKRVFLQKIIEMDCPVEAASSSQELGENSKNLTQNWGKAFTDLQAKNARERANVHNKNKINLKNNYKGTDLQNQTIQNQDALIKKLIAEKRDLEQKSNQKVVYLKNLLQKLAKQQVSKEKEKKAYDWSFQELPEFKALEDRLSKFGFSKREINGIWWRHVQNSRTDHTPNPAKLALLTDYIDYTELRQRLGKVDDAKKFLLSAIKRRFDLSKLAEIREQSKSKEQKLQEAYEREEQERQALAAEREVEQVAKEQEMERRRKVEAWIRQNPNHPIYSQCLEAFRQKNQFCYGLLVSKARKQRLSPLELMRLPKFSTTADLSGLYSEIGDLMGEREG